MGLTSLPKRGESGDLGPEKNDLSIVALIRRVFAREWNTSTKGLEEVCEEVGLANGSTEGSLVARVNALEGGGGGGGSAPGGEWEDAALTGGTGCTVVPAIVQGIGGGHALTFSRTGGAVVAAGDQVTVVSKVELGVTDGNYPDARWGGLPVEADADGGVVAQVRVQVIGGSYTYVDEFDVVLFDSGTKIRVLFGTPVTGGTTLLLSLHATYVARGPG